MNDRPLLRDSFEYSRAVEAEWFTVSSLDKKKGPSAQEESTVNVLLVQQDVADAQTMQRLLGQSADVPIQVTHVEWLSDALKSLSENSFDAILLDFDILDTHGQDTFNLVQSSVARVPIILLAKGVAEASALEAMRYGAQDYVIKEGMTSECVVGTIRKAILRKEAEKNLTYLAQQDHLTDVANRALFRDRVDQAVARRKRKPQSVAVLRLGLDGFAKINDEYGQEGGDTLLRTAASRLQTALREVDTVARLWGDEFTVLLDGMAKDADALLVAERLLLAIAEPFTIGDQEASLTASIGIALVGADQVTVDELLQQAEVAMRDAKGRGGNLSCVYQGGEG